jgi:hypothetical protein
MTKTRLWADDRGDTLPWQAMTLDSKEGHKETPGMLLNAAPFAGVGPGQACYRLHLPHWQCYHYWLLRPWHLMMVMRSENTPMAVTSAPAPGPRTISGWLLYRAVVNASRLSEPCSWASGWEAGYLREARDLTSVALNWQRA